MIVTRTSPISGKTNSMDLKVTQEQLNEYDKGIKHVQDVFSHLKPEEREFIMTGITPEEWDNLFDDEE